MTDVTQEMWTQIRESDGVQRHREKTLPAQASEGTNLYKTLISGFGTVIHNTFLLCKSSSKYTIHRDLFSTPAHKLLERSSPVTFGSWWPVCDQSNVATGALA